MDSGSVQDTLNRILLLEKSQVVLYSTMASKAPTEELAYGLQRLAKIENDHVLAIENKLKKLFPHQDNKIHQLKSSVADAGLKGFGSIVSTAQELTSIASIMKAGAYAEEKAMNHYRQMLTQFKDFELRDMFWEHLIDEELHYLWLKEKAARMN